jgi:outer membrane protein, adhesin transport system
LYLSHANELERSLYKEIQKEKMSTKFETIIKEGLINHPSISSMNEAIKIANSSVDGAKWGFFPTPSIELSQRGSTTQTTARLEQPIWTGGKLTSAYDISLSKKDEMIVSLQESKYMLIDNFINILQTYLIANAQIKSLMNGKNDLLNFVAMIERRIKAGASSQGDMSLLKSRISQIDSDLVSAKNQLELSKSQFEILSTLKVNSVEIEINDEIRESINMEESILKLKSSSPQIKNLEMQIKTAEYEIDSAKSKYMPTLSLRAEHTKGDIYDQSGEEQNLVYLAFSANTGAGLSLVSAVEGARAKASQLRFQQLTKEKELIELLVTTNNSMMSAYFKAEAMKKTIASSKDVLESYSRLFIAGKKQWLDLVNASKELMLYKVELAVEEELVKIMKYKIALIIGDIDLENGSIKYDL